MGLHIHGDTFHDISQSFGRTVLNSSRARQGNPSSHETKICWVGYLTNKKKILRRLWIQREKIKGKFCHRHIMVDSKILEIQCCRSIIHPQMRFQWTISFATSKQWKYFFLNVWLCKWVCITWPNDIRPCSSSSWIKDNFPREYPMR